MLRVKLKRLEGWNRARREIAQRYRSAFSGLSRLRCLGKLPDREHAYHLFVLASGERDSFRSHLESKEVGSQIHYPVPVHLTGAFGHLDLPAGSFPVAEKLCSEVVSIPLFPELTRPEMDQVVEAVASFEPEV